MKRWKSIGLLVALVLLGTPAARAFDTGPHQDLTDEVLREVGFSTDANRTAQLENWLVDYYSNSPTTKVLRGGEKSLEQLHFDGLTTSSRVSNYWDRLTVNTKISVQEAAREKDAFKLIVLIGMSLHAVQDFYTHSNWVETHPSPAGSDYATVTWFDSKKRDGVRTGNYPNTGKGNANDHGDYGYGMNHDSQSRPEFHRSYVFAYAASRQWVNQIRLWVNEVDPAIWNQAKGLNLGSGERTQLSMGMRSAFRVSEWVAKGDNDGHWKGKGSGSSAEWVAAVAAWIAFPMGRFTEPFLPSAGAVLDVNEATRRNCVFRLTTADGRGRQDLSTDQPSSVSVPEVVHIPIRKQVVVVRSTEIKELSVGFFETKIDSLGTADFFAKITIDGMTLVENCYQNKERVGNPWDTLKFVDDTKQSVDIHIEVWDEDLNNDDHCDINPGSKTDLDITLNTRTQALSGDISGVFDSQDKPWTSKGNQANRATLSAYCRTRKLADLPSERDTVPVQTLAAATKLPLNAGTVLKKGMKLTSPSGNHMLVVGMDGNLMIVKDGVYVWGTNQVIPNFGDPAAPGVDRVEFRADGSLSAYNDKGVAVWTAPVTRRDPTAKLHLSFEGKLQLVAGNGDILWAHK
ncbi:C2 domain-containing protein [Armatimonas sp.]|uniref:C2 domain-containing protein n=1 Tax=Armatimonas sp. TaxID=1872638 RepID=UPI00286AF8FC|nr:C2 domain-containing protein [Armatimonas sp.]